MSFDEKEAEDEGMHFPWLWVTSIHSKTSYDNNNSNNKQLIMELKVDESTNDKFIIFIELQMILERFALAWDLVVTENNDRKFHTQFRQSKIDNLMVTN